MVSETRQPSPRPALPRMGLLAGPLSDASAALARLDETARHSNVSVAWRCRETIRAAAALAGQMGKPVHHERVAAALARLPAHPFRDHGGLATALRLFRALGERRGMLSGEPDHPADDRPGAGVRMTFPSTDSGSVPAPHTGSALCDCVVSVWLSLRDEDQPLFAGTALMDALRERRILSDPEPAIMVLPSRREGELVTAWTRRALIEITASATLSHERLVGLETQWRLWHWRIGKRRSSSNLPRLVNLLASLPALSSPILRRRLGVSAQGASLLLRQARDAGVVTEASGRGTWKIYLPVDMRWTSGKDPAPDEDTVTPPLPHAVSRSAVPAARNPEWEENWDGELGRLVSDVERASRIAKARVDDHRR